MARQWSGGAVAPGLEAVLCPNPGPMTLDGTNTWLVGEGPELLVVDPGPQLEEHLQAVLARVRARGARVVGTLLTHRHDDHAESAERWAELTEAPVRGAGRGEPFADGELLRAGGTSLSVVLTPGHTGDSVSFSMPQAAALLTGDTVLGRGTSVVAHPDGNLAAYLDSLRVMAEVVRRDGLEVIAPGHGPALPGAAQVLEHYRTHREQRLDQVRTALDAGARAAHDPVEAVVEQVYADVPKQVWPAARLTVRAQLEYLDER